jgi:predicted RNase H-like HicB family nuclease
MEYLAIVERGSYSYGAYVPDLPGCVAVGETRSEVLKLIRDGINMHIESLREAGDEVPHPLSKSEVIKICTAQRSHAASSARHNIPAGVLKKNKEELDGTF